MLMRFNLRDVLSIIDDTDYVPTELELETTFSGFSPISSTKAGTLSWMRDQELDWNTVQASVVVCAKGVVKPYDSPCILIPVKNPRLVFTKLLREYASEDLACGIEESVVLGENCKIGEDVYIGHNSVVGDNVVIGEGTVIRNNVVIADNVSIGKNCLLKSFGVVGEKGFGFEKVGGVPMSMPHIGGVEIGDDVEVGSFASINRGTLGNTVIGKFVKIDDHVFIAHNVRVGDCSIIAGHTVVSGSVDIGRSVWIGPNACVRDGLCIGDHSLVGLGTVVMRNIKENSVVAGNPGRLIDRNNT